MRSKLRALAKKPSPPATVAFVVLAFVGSGLAMASIPDSTGVIHGCYKKKGGALRVTGGKCKKRDEKSLAWNQTGRKGPKGQNGRTGATGVPGSAKAYVYIDPVFCGAVTCVPAHAKNVTAVRRTGGTGSGIYCITATGLNPSNSFPVAGVDFATTSSPQGNATAMADSQNSDCDSATEAEVVTERIPGGTSPTTHSASGSNDVGFWFAYL